jgi:hypothetical protein
VIGGRLKKAGLWAGSVAQVVEHWPSMSKALDSSPSTGVGAVKKAGLCFGVEAAWWSE